MWIQRLQVVRFPQELQTPEESGRYDILLSLERSIHSPIHYSPAV
jgi:hypothetical protein